MKTSFFGVLILFFAFQTFSAQNILLYKATQGSQFYIDAEKVGIEWFQSKPKAYLSIVESKNIKGVGVERVKKIYVKVKTKDYPTDKILCEWIAKLDPGTYSLYVIPAAKGVKYDPVLVTEFFEVTGPVIDEMLPNHGNKDDEVIVTGEFFGAKKPKTWLQVLEKGKIKKTNCKIIEYSMGLEDGISELTFLVPKITPGVIYEFHIKNTIGEDTASFYGSNTAPVAVDDAAATTVNTAVTIPVLANDGDPEGDSLTVVSVSQPSHGAAVINGETTVTYTPVAGYIGTDSFLYTIQDPGALSSSATVYVTVNQESVNHPPVAQNDIAETEENTPVEIAVLLNDSDPDGDPITVIAVGSPLHGITRISSGGGKVTYTPDSGYIGPDSFTYTISDGRGGTDSATVAVTVKSSNSNPVAVDDTAETPKNTPVIIDVLANDSDPDGDDLIVSAVGTASHGTPVISEAGASVTYTPSNGYVGADSFTYTISDGNGGTDSATVSVTVTGSGGNTPPVAFNDSISTAKNISVEVHVLANDVDYDGDALTVTEVSAPQNGTAEITSVGTTVTYNPNTDFSGNDSFTYTISDGNGGTDTATVSVVVLAVSDGKYLVVDISGGASAASYSYEYLNSAPSDILTNDAYKTSKIALRKVDAGTFSMGSPEDEVGRFSNEPQHNVTLTQGYYVGVFEVTQTQYENVMGKNPSFYVGGMRPVENVNWTDARGGTWPSGNPAPTSFIGKISAKTGISFELPTEAEWEYACRAGTLTALNNGYNLETPAYSDKLALVGWYTYNSYEQKHQVVGQKTPNSWGLYDMHGNVWEWCLDYYGEYSVQDQTDPKGPASGEARTIRGGSWSYFAMNCRSAARNYIGAPGGFDNLGFRITAK